jgi:hypothetical protein
MLLLLVQCSMLVLVQVLLVMCWCFWCLLVVCGWYGSAAVVFQVCSG